MLTVVKTGPELLVQDLGRPGYASVGVSPSGALDTRALRAANRLVGNAESAAGLELLLGGAVLQFDDDALDAIADQALERGTGARGLRAIMEEVLLPVMFDLPSRDDIATVVITADVVAKKAQPTMIAHDVVAKRRNKSA